MKITDFFKTGSPKTTFLYVGEDDFQLEVFLTHLTFYENKNLKISHLDAKESFSLIFEMVCSRSMFANPCVYLIENFSALSKKQQTDLLKAMENPAKNPWLFVCPITPKFTIAKDCHLETIREETGKEALQTLTLHLMPSFGICKNPYLAKEIAKSCEENPMSIFSELRKLSIWQDEESKNLKIDEVLFLFQKPKESPIFEFLDRLGTRETEKCKKSLQTLQTENQNPLQLLWQIRSHFQKLFHLRNLINPLLDLDFKIKSNHWFLAKSKREKDLCMTWIREELSKGYSEPEKLQKKFKSDYYLAKLVWQTCRSTRQEMSEFLCLLNLMIYRMQSTSHAHWEHLQILISDWCEPKSVKSSRLQRR